MECKPKSPPPPPPPPPPAPAGSTQRHQGTKDTKIAKGEPQEPDPTGSAGTLAVGAELRYVVLHHTGVAAEHYDLLMEPPASSESGPGGRLLWTWRIESVPGTWTEGTGAMRQADHRAIYMEYEGEIAGNRGRVRRVAKGRAIIVAIEGGLCRCELRGGLRCVLRLPL